MNRARAFFYVCAGLFLLALSYHLGARSAESQGRSAAANPVAAMALWAEGGHTAIYVMQPNGDVHYRLLWNARSFHATDGSGGGVGTPTPVGNFWQQ